MTQKALRSLRDKEHDGAYVLQIGVSMAKLWPLISFCEYFMKCVFVPSVYSALC